MPRHHKPDRQLTRSRHYADPRSFVDIFRKEFLSGEGMGARRRQVYDRDHSRCMLIASARCRGFANWNDGEVHYVISRGMGGSDDLENLKWACGPCHRMQHVRPRWTATQRAEALG